MRGRGNAKQLNIKLVKKQVEKSRVNIFISNVVMKSSFDQSASRRLSLAIE